MNSLLEKKIARGIWVRRKRVHASFVQMGRLRAPVLWVHVDQITESEAQRLNRFVKKNKMVDYICQNYPKGY